MILLETTIPVSANILSLRKEGLVAEDGNSISPNSKSYRGGHSDNSETTSGDTIPSSIAEEDTARSTPSNTPQRKSSSDAGKEQTNGSTRGIPLSNRCSAERAGLPVDKFAKISEVKQISVASVSAFTDPKSEEAQMPLRRVPLRRHTSPPSRLKPSTLPRDPLLGPFEGDSASRNQNQNLSDRSTRSLYKRANSTADIPKLRSDSTKDTFNDEISRMRNSIIVKRNIKKQQRMDVHEIEDVFVGNRISEGHENFVMAYNMLTGLRVAVSRCSGVMKKINNEDFRSTKKLTFNMDGNELTPSSKYDFKFKDYCPEVFRELRTLFGIDPADYLISITGKYILSELGSPGKSGSFFYYSRDFRFIIKTIHHSEHKQLRRILKDYYFHVKNNPNTLISQFYGLHRLKVRGGMKKVHFIVMNNLFPPHRDIHQKYDLKGSTWGRFTKLTLNGRKEANFSQLTLKDLNWVESKEMICFGPKKSKVFLAQLKADVSFLKSINAMDYSLLLGIHDVKKGNSDTLTNLSVFDPKSNSKNDLINTNPRDIDREDLPAGTFPGRSRYIFYGHDGGIRGTDDMDEPLRVIYYLGIIDCLTNYSLKKRLETFFRSIGHGRSSISAVPANEYGDRFFEFIRKSTLGQGEQKL